MQDEHDFRRAMDGQMPANQRAHRPRLQGRPVLDDWGVTRCGGAWVRLEMSCSAEEMLDTQRRVIARTLFTEDA